MPEEFDTKPHSQNKLPSFRAEEHTSNISDQTEIRGKAESSKDFSTTDTNHHDPTNFRYLVHAINPDAALGLSIQRGQMSAESGYQMDEPHPPLTTPDKFGTRGYISCSVIDQDHLGTWGGSGFILGIEPENILVTCPTDAGTIPAKELDYLQRNIELLSFPELLSETDRNHYNEVVASGSGERSPVKITGVFVKYWFDGREYVPVDKRTAWKVEAFASMHHVPVIEIRLPKTEDFPLRVEELYDEFGTQVLKMGRDGKEFSMWFRQFPWDKKPNEINFINANTANYRSMTREERLQFLQELASIVDVPNTAEATIDLIKRAQKFLESEAGIKRDYTDPIDFEVAARGGMMHQQLKEDLPEKQLNNDIKFTRITGDPK